MSESRRRLLVAGKIPTELRDRLTGAYELVELDEASGHHPDDFEVLVTTSIDGASSQLMDEWPRLKLIACNGAGLDQIDMAAARARGIRVANTPDAVTSDTADFALGLIFALARNITAGDSHIRAGRWTSGKMSPSTRVRGKRLGIVGFGKIGSTIAVRAAAMGMSVAYCTRRRIDRAPFRHYQNIVELAHASDFLVLACPGGEETRHLVNAAVLGALGASGYLINVARGSVVDEEALLGALARHDIAGAALDVFDNEPAIDPRFLDCDNVVLTPHIAAITHETRSDIAETLAAAIEDHFTQTIPSPNA